MGNFWEKSQIKRDDVLKNIFQINQISKTLSFMRKLKVHLFFELDDESSSKRKSKKIIKVTIYDYDHSTCNVSKRTKPLYITLENFINYFNLVINTKHIFLREQIDQNIKHLKGTTDNDEDESQICPICSENSVNISLPCSHFFCEKCIKAWLIKSHSCPLCRKELKINKNSPTGISGAKSWEFMEDIDKDEFEKENMEYLIILTNKLFINQKN